MLDRIVKALASVAKFIGRFWPMSQDEATLLEELGHRQRGDDIACDGAIEGVTKNEP